jgi:uncharacterized repeat protein (TIGR03803 family)
VTKTLHGFSGGADGANPAAGVILDAAGNVYGTTENGGAHGDGVVYKLTPHANGKWTERVLYSFTGAADGSNPFGALVFDAAGNLYGTTVAGGLSCPPSCGVVFKLSPNSNGTWTESVLYSFKGGSGDGANPYAGVIFDSAGNLYGTTYSGGSGGSTGGNCSGRGGCGVVYELTPNSDGSWSEQVLYLFAGGNNDGSNPQAPLVFDTAGNLYGTATFGGPLGYGMVFELTNSQGTWQEKPLYLFGQNGQDNVSGGVYPYAGLTFDGAGNLYGAAEEGGGHGWGAVYELLPNGDGSWSEHAVYSFTGGNDGALPFGTPAFDCAGNLYGTTDAGGFFLRGVVYELIPSSTGWQYKRLHSFMDLPGAGPFSGVVFDAAGNLYGTTAGIDSQHFGSVFEITP